MKVTTTGSESIGVEVLKIEVCDKIFIIVPTENGIKITKGIKSGMNTITIIPQDSDKILVR